MDTHFLAESTVALSFILAESVRPFMPEFVTDIELSVPRSEESPLVVPALFIEEELPEASIVPVEADVESVVDSVVEEV